MYGQGLLTRYYLYTREVLGGQQRSCRGLNRRGRVCLPDERLANNRRCKQVCLHQIANAIVEKSLVMIWRLRDCTNLLHYALSNNSDAKVAKLLDCAKSLATFTNSPL